jgi:hypothetical protein
MSDHAKISPSGFKRLMACPASLTFAAQFPNVSGAAAIEGTACHEALEKLFDGQEPGVGEVMSNGFVLEDFHVDAIEEIFTWVAKEKFDNLWTELQLPIGLGLGLADPDLCWGTSDVVGVKDGCLWIMDLKMGFNEVSVHQNPQTMLYMIGALAHPEVAKALKYTATKVMTCVIMQPRQKGVTQSVISREDLLEFAALAVATIDLALGDDPKFGPSEEGCRWCPASGVCRAQMDWALRQDFGDPNVLTNEEIADLLDREAALRQALDNLRSHALNLMAAGQTVPGWKRVAGQARARYIDEEEVIEYCKQKQLDLDVVAPRKPIAQSYLAKLVGKAVIETLITRPEGSPTLARYDDKRPALDGDFEALD